MLGTKPQFDPMQARLRAIEVLAEERALKKPSAAVIVAAEIVLRNIQPVYVDYLGKSQPKED